MTDDPTAPLSIDLSTSELADLPLVSDGEFEIIRELDRGSFGKTILAVCPSTPKSDQRVVIKTLLPRHAADANMVRRFIREAKALIKLTGSPHIVKFRELKA